MTGPSDPLTTPTSNRSALGPVPMSIVNPSSTSYADRVAKGVQDRIAPEAMLERAVGDDRLIHTCSKLPCNETVHQVNLLSWRSASWSVRPGADLRLLSGALPAYERCVADPTVELAAISCGIAAESILKLVAGDDWRPRNPRPPASERVTRRSRARIRAGAGGAGSDRSRWFACR
jgi:hypothetical protein